MKSLLSELDHISDMIAENTEAADDALRAFTIKNQHIKNRFVSAKADLLRLVIASVFNNYDKQNIDDEKLQQYFELNGKFDEAAQLLLTKARHHFTHGDFLTGENILQYVQKQLRDKISPRVELVYLTRVAFLHGRKQEYDERMKVSLLALEKLRSMKENASWYHNLYTIFCTNIAESYFNNSDFDKAWPYLAESLEIAEKHKIATYNKFNVYSYFAFYFELKKEWKKSAGWHDKIINLLKGDEAHSHYAIQSYLMAAEQFFNLNKESSNQKQRSQYIAKQEQYLQQVPDWVKTDMKNGHNLLWTIGVARLEFQHENFEKAIKYLNECLPAYEKNGNRKAAMKCTELMQEIYYSWGRKGKDYEKLLKAYSLQKSNSEIMLTDWKETNRHKLDAIQAKHQLQKKELNEKLMEQQMEAMNKEMRLTALNLHEKILLLDELKIYVHSLKEKEFEMRKFINAISQKINAIKITEKEKAVLQEKMDAGNTGFSKVLAHAYPSLTSHELQMCGLFKTGMNNKELSKLYGLSEKGYELLRYRIKKKMKLKRNQNLVKHLIEFPIENRKDQSR